jgi:hypothetical protein
MGRIEELRTALWSGARRALATCGAERGDAALYAGCTIFAALTVAFSSLGLYRQWALLAVGPYALAALASGVLAHFRAKARRAHVRRTDAVSTCRDHRERRWRAARAGVFVFVLAGATVLPLALEVVWQADGSPGRIQPEGPVIERAAHRLAEGKQLYPLVVRSNGRDMAAPRGQATYELFFPYLPLMTVFGLPSTTKAPVRLTDVRIFFSVATVLVVGGALLLCRAPRERKIRTLQVLTVLPTAALPLATGGDDMPVVAFLLLAMVLARTRRPGWSGLVLGVVSAMKFTAWPLAALALFAARDRQGRRAPGRMLLGMVAVAGPVVLPFALQNGPAFLQNVIMFPLGLTNVASPAASALPGHLLVTAVPVLHRVLPLALVVVGGSLLVRRLVRRPPATASEVCALAGWVMAVAVLFAPATRVGYLLYPVNFFVWSYLLRTEVGQRRSRPAQGAPTLELGRLDDADRPAMALAGFPEHELPEGVPGVLTGGGHGP